MTTEWEIQTGLAALSQVPEVRSELGYAANEKTLRGQLWKLYVGAGASAVAFLTPSEEAIFKVVFDADQATLSRYAQRERPHGIVRVFAVYGIGPTPWGKSLTRHRAWVVIETPVVPIDLLNVRARSLTGAAKRDAERAVEAADWAIGEVDAEKEMRDPPAPESARPKRLREAFRWDLRKAWAWVMTHAVDPGDICGDLSDSNVGYDPETDTLVILDLGQATVVDDTIAAED